MSHTQTKAPSALRRETITRNWRRFRLHGVVQTLRSLGFPQEAASIQFHLDEEARMWERKHSQQNKGTR